MFLDGLEIQGVLGFDVHIEGCNDPEVVLRVAVNRVDIDGYTDVLREKVSQT